MHVGELRLFNMLKFHQIQSRGMANILGKKSAKIQILHFFCLFRTILTQDYGHTSENNLMKF